MPTQADYWSRAAEHYEADFIDPFRPDVPNPLLPALEQLARDGAQTAADLGCGTGPLLPFLAQHFPTVYAVDFAAGMLERARQRCGDKTRVRFLQLLLTDLAALPGPVDVAVAANSLVMPDIRDQEESLRQILAQLKPGGHFLAILPAMDAVHYYTMLLVDRSLAQGRPSSAARKNAAHHAEHDLYDFAFGQFRFKGLEQHFWQPFEIRYRLERAGFRDIRMSQLPLSWDQFACAEDLRQHLPPWDWFVQAERPS